MACFCLHLIIQHVRLALVLTLPIQKEIILVYTNSDFDSRRVFTISTSNLTVMLVLIPFFTHAGVTIGKLDSMKFNGLIQSEYFFTSPPFENTVINKTERFSFLSVITFMILSYFGSSVLIS